MNYITYRQTLTRLSQPPLTKRLTGADREPVVESKAALGPIAGAQLTALHPIYNSITCIRKYLRLNKDGEMYTV
jgi:hypothetical protein